MPRSQTAAAPGPPCTFAFQPIVDARRRIPVSYEALVRGLDNSPAHHIFSQVAPEQRYAFDRHCRSAAIELAAALSLSCDLNLNFLPQSLQSAEQSIRATVAAAVQQGLPLDRIVLEVTEGEAIIDQCQFAEFTNQYRSMGLKLAMDDFGAGYSGLNLLADFQPDQLKLDKALIRSIQSNGPRQAIIRALIQVCSDLAIDLIAEGVETVDEYSWLLDQGVHLFQGYLFARPGFRTLPAPHFPSLFDPAPMPLNRPLELVPARA